MSISDAVFLVTSVSNFDHSAGWYDNFDVLIFIHLLNSTGVVVVALANLRWTVFVSINLKQIGSFH